ncbi:MAG: CBS domain-containing protein [Chlorobi bacterium]|nr:CBS domain-containing protein [Chlorobiota bacterium]
MIVKNFMRTNYVSVSLDTPIKRVNQFLHQFNIKYVLVTEKEDELIGIITYTDLFRHLLPSYVEFLTHADENIFFPENIEERTLDLINKPVKEIMTKEPETVKPELPLIEAGALMLATKVKQLPVVEGNKLVGVISYTDITWGLMIKNCKYF